MLDDTVEILTKQMLEDIFKEKNSSKKVVITMSKIDLYKFCIKLVKLIQQVERKED